MTTQHEIRAQTQFKIQEYLIRQDYRPVQKQEKISNQENYHRIFSSNHLCWVTREVLYQLPADRNSSSHLTFQIQCTSQYFQATSTEQIIKREKGKRQVSQSKLTNLSNSFGASVLHHVFPSSHQPDSKDDPQKYPWNQPHFPRFQAQLNLIHQKEKEKENTKTNKSERK